MSVLDTFFEDDDEHESLAGEEEDHDLERSYANIESECKYKVNLKINLTNNF